MQNLWIPGKLDRMVANKFKERTNCIRNFVYFLLFPKRYSLSDVVYFTDWRQGGIVAIQRSDPSTATIMRSGVDKMYSIRVYDKDEQPVRGK